MSIGNLVKGGENIVGELDLCNCVCPCHWQPDCKTSNSLFNESVCHFGQNISKESDYHPNCTFFRHQADKERTCLSSKNRLGYVCTCSQRGVLNTLSFPNFSSRPTWKWSWWRGASTHSLEMLTVQRKTPPKATSSPKITADESWGSNFQWKRFFLHISTCETGGALKTCENYQNMGNLCEGDVKGISDWLKECHLFSWACNKS